MIIKFECHCTLAEAAGNSSTLEGERGHRSATICCSEVAAAVAAGRQLCSLDCVCVPAAQMMLHFGAEGVRRRRRRRWAFDNEGQRTSIRLITDRSAARDTEEAEAKISAAAGECSAALNGCSVASISDN